MFILRRMKPSDEIFKEPKKRKAPPWWVRSILILTCSGVSVAHGANDGQKGVGLIMLILIGIVPAKFALDMHRQPTELHAHLSHAQRILGRVDTLPLGVSERATYRLVTRDVADLQTVFAGPNKNEFDKTERFHIRKDILVIHRETERLLNSRSLAMTDADRAELKANVKGMRGFTDYAPQWVIVLISVSLGLGTMVGWRRIVETIGEKIGKQHLTYAQGMSSELVAASTIGLSTYLGLPVSTTHVLSSGIAGSMVASRGLKNLQPETVRNIALAWLLTLPVTVTLSGMLYLLFRAIF